MRNYDNEIPLFLSGGIGKNDAKEIQKLDFLKIESLDINSKFELEPALKDTKAVTFFIQKLNELSN